MISWFARYHDGIGNVTLGIHDSGVCCFMDYLQHIPEDELYRCTYAMLNTGTAQLTLKGLGITCDCYGNPGEITELLDKYIQDHPHLDYLMEWDLTRFAKYTEVPL